MSLGPEDTLRVLHCRLFDFVHRIPIGAERRCSSPRGGRARRHFTVTAAGVRALNASRAATHNIWRGLAFPLKVRP